MRKIFRKAFCKFSPDFKSENGFEFTKKRELKLGVSTLRRNKCVLVKKYITFDLYFFIIFNIRFLFLSFIELEFNESNFLNVVLHATHNAGSIHTFLYQ